MKIFMKWMFLALLGISFANAATVAAIVDFRETEGVFMKGETSGGLKWSAVPAHLATESDIDSLREIYANPEAMKYWLSGATATGEDFEKALASLREERSLARFGKGHPHGMLIVRNGEGICIGHAVIGPHFGHKGIGVSAFLFDPKSWDDGYVQAVAAAYFNTWVPEVVERGYDCFTGGNANDDWASDGKLRYLMTTTHPDYSLEVAMMDSHNFRRLTEWQKKRIDNLTQAVNSSEDVAGALAVYWAENSLLDNKLYNIMVNGVPRSVIKFSHGFRFVFWRKAVLAKEAAPEASE